MGRKCCIPGCTIGHASNPKPKDVMLFCFPSNESMKQAWINEIKKIRKDWELSVCSKGSEEFLRTKGSELRQS